MSQTPEELNGGSIASTPRWAKVFGIIALVLMLVFVILHLVSPGRHDLLRHTRAGDASGHAPTKEHRGQQP